MYLYHLNIISIYFYILGHRGFKDIATKNKTGKSLILNQMTLN